MSASEKKAQRNEQRRQEEQKDRRSVAVYSVIAAAVVIAAVVLMILNSGLLQRSLTAVTINGFNYTVPELQYYYSTQYNNLASSYAFDSSTSVKKQTYDQETGQSWHDHIMELAIEDLTTDTTLAARAESEGYTLSQEAQDSLDSNLEQLNTMWVGYGATSRDAFIRAQFGAYMTYDKLVSLFHREVLASDYASAQLDAIDHPDSDCEAYYRENADNMDTIVYSQLAFRAYVPTQDEEGNPIEMTDEEKTAALEESKAEQKALAQEVEAKLRAGAEPEDLAEEYADQLYSSVASRRASGSNVVNSIYADWLLDSSRRSGDITITEQETVDSYFYYVARFEERLRDEENTNSVRHILIRATGDVATSTPTQTQYDVAEEKAQELLDQWRAGEATEDSFAQLATDNTEDTGSRLSGGLISGINSSSNYVEPFRDWAIDPSRRPGDTELVKSEYGWHVMYYVSTDDPAWKLTALSALRSQDREQLETDVVQGWSASQGIGAGFVG
ncbi:hypothetical protein D1646_04420 [Pseudoflavonifractor sp. 60]|uniref:peptidylprolyl isomerase n=1 Tax=Pseudoflavonifractor sp. 60 TaxID=2304576 RepID=UPI00136C3850|nr:hypothetical protein [Pseudoflavonifractor sp. 60]